MDFSSIEIIIIEKIKNVIEIKANKKRLYIDLLAYKQVSNM